MTILLIGLSVALVSVAYIAMRLKQKNGLLEVYNQRLNTELDNSMLAYKKIQNELEMYYLLDDIAEKEAAENE